MCFGNIKGRELLQLENYAKINNQLPQLHSIRCIGKAFNRDVVIEENNSQSLSLTDSE